MALEYYDNRNKRTDVPLHFEYSLEQMSANYQLFTNWRFGSRNWWRITRRARKTYTYVGLSQAAAARCAQEKLRKYTRPFLIWLQNSDGSWAWRNYGRANTVAMLNASTNADMYFACVADANIMRGDGELYSVQISVDEEVVIYDQLAILADRLPDERTMEGFFKDKRLSCAYTFDYDE